MLEVEGSGCDQERDLGLTVYTDKVNPKDLSEGGICTPESKTEGIPQVPV